MSAPPQPPAGDVAWAESRLYGPGDFPRYNPDDLIGRKGFAIYDRMMLDEQLKAVVHFKRDAITARGWFFELESEELDEPERRRRIALLEHIVAEMEGSFADSLNGMLTAITHGFSMTEMVYRQIPFDGMTWWGLEALRLKPFDSFYFHTDEFGNAQEVEQKIGNQTQRIDLAKFIHYVHNPESDRWYGRSDLRECYRDWFSKDMAVKFHNIWLERHGAGFIWAQPKEGGTLARNSEKYNDLVSVLKNVQAKTAMIIPGDIDLHVVFPRDNVNFIEARVAADKGMAKSLLVPNLLGISEQGQTGSYSQSKIQLRAFFWTLEAIAQRLAECLNEQLFRSIGRFNFPDRHYPRFRFQPASGDQKLEIVKTWIAAIRGGAAQPSEADEQRLRQMLDMPPAPAQANAATRRHPGDGGENTAGRPGDRGENTGRRPGDGGEGTAGRPGDGGEGTAGRPGSNDPAAPAASIGPAAMARAAGRVDFAVIEYRGERLARQAGQAVGTIMAEAIAGALDIIAEKKPGTPSA
ncbi:MAG: DUF935 family protein, partial [bacterium]